MRVCLGVITSVHGIRGEVKIKYFSERPESLSLYPLTDKFGSCFFEIERIRQAGDCLIAKIKGVEDRTQAESLRGVELYTERANLPETKANEFYIEDLRGLCVRSVGGDVIGAVHAVHGSGTRCRNSFRGLRF